MAKRVKKLLKEMQETGQEVYGTRDRPFRTAGNVLVDAALGGKKLKTNLALKAAQAAKRKAAELAAKREANKALKKAKEFDLSDLKAQAEANKYEKELRDQIYKGEHQELLDILNQQLEQAKKDAQKTPKTPTAKHGMGKPGMGKKTKRTGQGSMAGPGGGLFMGSGSGGSGLTPRVTITEVETDEAGGSGKGGGTKRAKGGMINKKPSAKKTSKKKTSVQKKPRGVGAATRGYGRALR